MNVNQSIPFDIQLQLDMQTDTWVYDNDSFFPIDNMGFGNEGNQHNYHFTYEVHTNFTYEGGEQFTFRGDDDVWVFINGKRIIDLGGVHPPQQQMVDIDGRRQPDRNPDRRHLSPRSVLRRASYDAVELSHRDDHLLPDPPIGKKQQGRKSAAGPKARGARLPPPVLRRTGNRRRPRRWPGRSRRPSRTSRRFPRRHRGPNASRPRYRSH